MLKAPTSFGWSRGYSIALIILGVFFLLCGWGMWSANAPKATSAGDWIEIVLFEVFFVGVGLFTIGFRMQFTVFPAERRAVRTMRFLGIPFKSNGWRFTEFSGVEIKVTSGARGSQSAAIKLTRNMGDPVLVTTFMMRGNIPKAAQDLAHELSETMGIPFSGVR